MKSLLGKFFKGILYIVTLPILLVVLAIFSIFGLFYFIGLSIKGIVLFFQGKSLFKDLPEDVEVRKIKEARNLSSGANDNFNNFVVEQEPENEETPVHILESNKINTPVIDATIASENYDDEKVVSNINQIENNQESMANLEQNNSFSHINDENDEGQNNNEY